MIADDASLEQRHDKFESSRLVASDYDGTQFDTFTPPLGGMGVGEAYEQAIKTVLGPYALDEYKLQGGHKNRTPSAIIESLINRSDGRFLHLVLELAQSGASTEELAEVASRTKHPAINQGLIYIDPDHLKIITDTLVFVKLAPLLAQIGQKLDDGSFWPNPIDGFLDFALFAEQVRRDGVPLNTAVISAGHTQFIEKTYALYGVENPDIFVTDEIVRSLVPNMSAERRGKPAPIPMLLAKRSWLDIHDVSPSNLRNETIAPDINARIIYIGDDPEKDGGLAKNSHIDFIWVDPASPRLAWQAMQRYIEGISV
ncbi:MAG: hypothetical protein Q7T41_00440 [Candidatus Saccharibacteria bacterium]|nr:hypothetical protein [Candidatus Saccharibacteria bacterium]